MTEEIEAHVDSVDELLHEQKTKFSEFEEALPLELKEKIDEYETLRDTLQVSLPLYYVNNTNVSQILPAN